MAARFLFGVCQGPLFPIQTGILAAWLHESERSTLNAVVGLCWSLFQAIQSALTPYFMTGPGWEWVRHSPGTQTQHTSLGVFV